MCYNPSMKTYTKNHLIYPDIAKGIGIILVVLGHIEYISLPLRNFIVSFHMPLFFVISGILMNLIQEEKRDLGTTAAKKAKRILLPYVYFSLLDTIVYLIYFYATGRDGGFSTIFSYLVNSLTLYGISVLWFLPALYGSELLFLKIRQSSTKPLTAVISVVCSTAAIVLNYFLSSLNNLYGLNMGFAFFRLFAVSILRMLFCSLFISFGYFIFPIIKKVEEIFSRKIFTIFSFSVILILLCFFTSQLNGITDLHYLIFNNIFLYLIAALSGSSGIIFLSLAFAELPQNFLGKLLVYYGKNSIIIMLTHLDFYILYLAEIGGLHFSKPLLGKATHDTLLSFLSLIFVLLAEFFIIIFVNRFCPYLIGKSKERNYKEL